DGPNPLPLGSRDDGPIIHGLLDHVSTAYPTRAPRAKDACSSEPIHFPQYVEQLTRMRAT
ncbi:hypothetical protein A2U01_0059679, partial [Trifolium medium]|nr:hypothetical protein [Trifolium medium]